MDHIHHPKHYNSQPIECICITEMYLGNISNLIKYLWRADLKDTKIDNLQKALVYLQREIKRMQRINIPKRYKANPELYDLPKTYKELNLTFNENIDKILSIVYPSYTHNDLLKIEKILIQEIENLLKEK